MEYRDITPEDELDNNCYYCGLPCEGAYCSDECSIADYKENCTD